MDKPGDTKGTSAPADSTAPDVIITCDNLQNTKAQPGCLSAHHKDGEALMPASYSIILSTTDQ